MDRNNVLLRLSGSAAIGFLLGVAPATAGQLDLPFGVEGSYNLTLGYAAAMRMQDQHPALTDGRMDPLELALFPDPDGQIVGFERTGLPDTSNFDDGNRNFDKYSLIHNRVSALFEMDVERDNLAFVLSGSAFYDNVYMRDNDNVGAEYLNRLGPDGQSGQRTNTDRFSDEMKSRNGRRIRLLEAYGIADFPFGDFSYLNLRIGQQLVTWGEALFFGGMARDQAPADASKGFVPGAEIKDILLPTPQVAVRLGLGLDWTFKGYYKFKFEENEIFPVGSYFSPSDIVGPGAEFAYGSINPAYLEGCPGLLDVGQFNDLLGNLLGDAADLSQLCNLGGLGETLLNAPRNILTYREEDIRPGDSGQWGVGFDYRLTPGSSVGLHYVRYHNPNPSPQMNTGFAPLGSIAGIELTTGLINQRVPVDYNIRYFDDIELISGTVSTTLFGLSVAGELNYRNDINIDVSTVASGVPTPVAQRGETAQVLMSAISTFAPRFFFDEMSIVGEAQYIRVLDVDPLTDPQPGIIPDGEGDELFFDKESAGFQLLMLPRKRNFITGWDLSGTLSYAELSYGHPAQAGSFGALFGEGDRRLSVGGSMQYLQNFQIGMSYNMFFGDPMERIGGDDSLVRANPFVDRNYLTVNAKYQF